MAVAFSGLVLIVVATGSVYLVDAAASSRRFARAWRICGVALSIVLALAGLRLVLLAMFDNQSTIVTGAAILVAATTVAIILSQSGRRIISAVLPLDRSSARDWLGLLAVLLLVTFRLALFYRGESDIGEVRVSRGGDSDVRARRNCKRDGRSFRAAGFAPVSASAGDCSTGLSFDCDRSSSCIAFRCYRRADRLVCGFYPARYYGATR